MGVRRALRWWTSAQPSLAGVLLPIVIALLVLPLLAAVLPMARGFTTIADLPQDDVVNGLLVTLVYATMTSVLQVLVGYGLAILVHRLAGRAWLARAVAAVIVLPYVLPTGICADLWGRLMEPRFLIPIYSAIELDALSTRPLVTLVLASVWQYSAFPFLFLLAALNEVPQEHRDIAAVEALSRLRRFWLLEFQPLLPTLGVLLLLRFAWMGAKFDTPFLLTDQYKEVWTLPLYIYKEQTKCFGDPVCPSHALAFILGFCYVAIAITAWGVYRWLRSSRTSLCVRRVSSFAFSLGTRRYEGLLRAVAAAGLSVLFALYVAPLLVLALGAIEPGAFSSLRTVLSEPEFYDTVALSAGLALGALALSLAVGFPAAWALVRHAEENRRRVGAAVRTLSYIAYAFPTIVPAIGYQTLLRVLREGLPAAEYVLLSLALALFTLPFLILLLAPTLRRTDESAELVARMEGHGSLLILLRVVFPTVRRSVAAAILFAAAIAANELTFPLLLLSGQKVFAQYVFDLPEANVAYESIRVLFVLIAAALLTLLVWLDPARQARRGPIERDVAVVREAA